mgnify:CR=1 FL=1
MPVTEHTMEFGGKIYTIYAGKDAKSNDQLLDDCDPDDIWFHVAEQSSGHVILKNEEKFIKISKSSQQRQRKKFSYDHMIEKYLKIYESF